MRKENRDIPDERVMERVLRSYDRLAAENHQLRQMLSTIPIDTLRVVEGEWAETVRCRAIIRTQINTIKQLKRQCEQLRETVRILKRESV